MRNAFPTIPLLLLAGAVGTFTACGGSSSNPETDGDAGAADGARPSPPEAGSTGTDGGRHADGGPLDAAAPGLGPDGGNVSTLYFAVVGDTRPPTEDDMSGYPTGVITKIYQDIEALEPRPPFVVSTGDYQFSSTGSHSTASQQVAMYMQARALYSGLWYPAMGNHECTGGDTSNCPAGSNPTANFSAFASAMLEPIQKTLPYYVIHVNAADGAWTAKFVITAANAWDSNQQAWLTSAMAEKTTYTFVVRHEPSTSTPIPAGVGAIDSIIGSAPYTLLIVGHSHEYGHYSDSPKVALLGNGGAPLTNPSKNYGYGTFTQRADGAIVCDELDYMSGAKDPNYHFVIKADGTLTQ
jgi:hypothetical protein